MSLNDTHDHIKLLHDSAAGIDGKLVLAAFGENLAPIVKHFSVGDVSGMFQAATDLSQRSGYNIYMPLAVMRTDLLPTSKGKKEDVIALLGFVADYDKGMGADYTTRCPIKPSYALETSPNNVQCFFLLDKPLSISSDSDHKKADELATKLTQACNGADSCGADISHVWRIPGLLNWPNQKKLKEGRDPKPYMVKTLEPFNGHVTTNHIESLSAAAPISLKSSAVNLQLEYKKPVDLHELAASGDNRLISLIKNGAPKGERSEAVSSVAWSLLNREHGTGDIVDIILQHPSGIGERYGKDQSRIEADVLRLAVKKAGQVAEPEHPSKSYILKTYEPIDAAQIPPRPWILGHHLMRGKVTLIIAPPGVGKSTASLTMAMSVATGKELFGIPVYEAGAVGVINNEDDVAEMRRRVTAIQKFHKIQPSELKGRFFLQSGEDMQFIIAKRNKEKNITPHHKDDIIAFCKAHSIKVLFVDPFLETHEADENDNRQINEVARMYRDVAQQADCAIVLIHHTRKLPGSSSTGHAGNADSGRGASSLVGVARIVCTLYDMSESDAKHYGVAEEERHLYVRFDDAKANLSLKSNQALWYRRETVCLANGDKVGVLCVANNLQNAVAPKATEQASKLLAAIKGHSAFEKLREDGKMKREAFISAMLKAGVFLGLKTESRSTLQGRLDKVLLGKGLTDATTSLYMKKTDSRYTVYADFEDDAELPDDTINPPASQTQQGFAKISPNPAEFSRQNLHIPAENLAAGLPPL